MYRLNADSESCMGLVVMSNPWVLTSWGFELSSFTLGKILTSCEPRFFFFFSFRKMGIIKYAGGEGRGDSLLCVEEPFDY